METRLLIGGELVAGNGPELAVEDPTREETIATALSHGSCARKPPSIGSVAWTRARTASTSASVGS